MVERVITEEEEGESKGNDRNDNEAYQVSHSVQDFSSHSYQVSSLCETLQQMNHSYPYKECCCWIEGLFHLGRVWIYEGVINDNENHDDKWEYVSIAPQHDLVICKTFDLKEILVEEIEAA